MEEELVYLFVLLFFFEVDSEGESLSVSELTGEWDPGGASIYLFKLTIEVLFPFLFGTSIELIGKVLL